MGGKAQAAGTCASAPVPITVTNTAGRNEWLIQGVPNVAFLKVVNQSSEIPANRNMVFRFKNSNNTTYTFVGEKLAEHQVDSAGVVYGSGPGSVQSTSQVLGFYRMYGMIQISKNNSYLGTFGTIFYNTQSNKYAYQPGGGADWFNATYPNYTTRCTVEIEHTSYANFLKAVGYDVSNGQAVAEDLATTGGIGSADVTLGTIGDNGTVQPDDEGACGKPSLKDIFRYSLCSMLDFLVRTLTELI